MVPVWAYALLALALSALLLPFNNFIGYDGVYYARMAENIISGKGITAGFDVPYAHPPLYPFLMGLFSKFLFNDVEFSGHFISILTFALTVIPLFLLAQSIHGRATAHWASFLYATHGFLLINSNLVMAESLFIFFITALIYFVHQFVQDKDGDKEFLRGISIGTLAGLAYLTRPEGLFFFTVAVLSILILSTRPLIVRSRVVLISLLSFLVFAVPYASFVYQKAHKLPLTGAMTEMIVMKRMQSSSAEQYLEHKKIYEGLTADKQRMKVEELAEQFDFFDYLKANDFALLKQVLPSLVVRIMGISQYLFGGLGFLLIGAGLLGKPWDQKRKRSEFLLLFFLSTFLAVLFGIFMPKRYLTYFPILIIWMGQGIETLRNWAKGSFALGQKSSLVAASTVCLLFCFPSAWYLQRIFTEFPMPFENKELGLWMKNSIPGVEAETVAARHRSVNFYAGAQIIKLPYVEKIEDLLTYLSHQRARYFVVSTDLDPPFLESYGFLLDEKIKLPRGIRRIHTVKGRNNKVILYEVKP